VATFNCLIAVEFVDLWKFHAPVNIVEGFDISLFDKLIEVRKTYHFTFRPEKMASFASVLVWPHTYNCFLSDLSGIKADK